MLTLAASDQVTVFLAAFQLVFSAIVSISLWRLTAWQRKYEGLEGKLNDASSRLIDERFSGMTRQVDRHVQSLVVAIDEMKQRMVFGDADVRALGERDFAWRHRTVCLLLAAHLPVLFVLGGLRGGGFAHGALEAGGVALFLGLALGPVSRRTAAVSATLGLLTCSALLVHLFDGRAEMHFHYFVAVALVALYQDWRVLAVAGCMASLGGIVRLAS